MPQSAFTHPRLRTLLRPLFGTNLGRSLLTRLMQHTRTPWFFGPFAQRLEASRYACFPLPTAENAAALGAQALLVKAPDAPLAGRRVALMAHWDPDGVIDPTVRHYARHLGELGFAVVLATGSDITVTEEDARIFCAITRRACPGYDFTSHRAAFEALPELFAADELLLTNDSVFGPVGSLAPLFTAMQPLAADFWGLAEIDDDPRPFLFAYFLLLRSPALTSEAFRTFVQSIRMTDDKGHACDCEMRLTGQLLAAGLSGAAYLPANAMPHPAFRPLRRAWQALLSCHMGLLKRSAFTEKASYLGRNWEEVLTRHSYPAELVQNYLTRRAAVSQARRAG